MGKKNVSKYLRFENARELIRGECIGSIAMFDKWYQHNKPNRFPRRPDIIYKNKGWISWNDFLGNNNKFKHTGRKEIVSYEECKRFARSKGIKTWEQWIAFSKSGQRPNGIPGRPDYVYKEWFSWKDFLGTEFRAVVKEVLKVFPVLYVIKMSNTPSNVFKVNMTNGGKEALLVASKQGAKIIAAFECTNPDVNWSQKVLQYANNYWYGAEDDYAFTNLQGFLFDISNILIPLKW